VIQFHIADKGILHSGPPDLAHAIPLEVLWIDVCSPTADEEVALERRLGFDIPTREEMGQIEH
jgi:magnesium transporter